MLFAFVSRSELLTFSRSAFGIEFEFLAKVDNEFYQSDEFKNIVAESISEYRQGKTDDMDLSK
jgi:hypothetical protein